MPIVTWGRKGGRRVVRIGRYSDIATDIVDSSVAPPSNYVETAPAPASDVVAVGPAATVPMLPPAIAPATTASGQEAINEAAAERVIADINAAYSAGATKIGWNPDAIARAVLLGGLGFSNTVSGWFTSATEAAVQHNYAQLGQHIADWETIYLSWAKNGQRDDGTPYSWTLWASFAGDLASEIQGQVNTAWDSSIVMADLSAIQATGDQIHELAAQAASDVNAGIRAVKSNWGWLVAGAAAIGAIALWPQIKMMLGLRHRFSEFEPETGLEEFEPEIELEGYNEKYRAPWRRRR